MHFNQLVNSVTRPISGSCLDHFYSTNPEYITHLSIPDIGIADHLPIFIRRKYTARKNTKLEPEHITIKYRDTKNLNIDELLNDLSVVPWDVGFIFDDVDDVLFTYEKLLNDVINQHTPLREKRVKQKCQPPWFNKTISEAIKERDSLLRNARITNSADDWQKYKRAKCKVINFIRKAKRLYFNESIDQNRGNPKGVWRSLRNLCGKSNQSTSIKQLKTTTGTIENPKMIAECLNNHFVNISSQIHTENDSQSYSNLSQDSKLVNFINSRIDNDTEFGIPLLNEKETFDLIRKLPTNTATGHDGISAKLLKTAAPILTRPLQRLLNYSISSSMFPSSWKIARVAPIHKNGPKDECHNYRPISVLSTLSKVLEKHVSISLYSYLQDNNLIYINQSAFRAHHSTETALIRLTDRLLFNMDQDKLTGMIFIDFRKAFDVIDHATLLQKLQLYGATSSTVEWFQSYLSERKQYVQLSNHVSSILSITDGIPQGSNLGPILFLLFINDLPLHVNSSTVDIYADDVTLYAASHRNSYHHIKTALSNDLNSIAQWSCMNKMVINDEKTKSMLITGMRQRNLIDDITLDMYINNNAINQVRSHKLLGIELDDNLTFTTHIEEHCKKLSKRIGLLRHISPYLKRPQRELFYNTVIKPTLLYGSSVWSYGNKDLETSILKLQKRAARIILGVERQTRSVDMFNSLNWLPFTVDSYINRCALIYKRVNEQTPKYLNEILKLNSDIHSRKTRYSKLNLICPRIKRLTEGGRSFSVRSIKDWNNLDKQIKESINYMTFKRTLYKNIVQEQKNNLRFFNPN